MRRRLFFFCSWVGGESFNRAVIGWRDAPMRRRRRIDGALGVWRREVTLVETGSVSNEGD